MSDKKKKILLIIGVVILLLLTVFLVGRSFGFFTYIKEGEVVNIITIKGINIEILNPDDDALNLTNAYPMHDEQGLELTPFEFTMTNTASKALSYSIKVELDEEKMESCTLEDGTACPELTTDYIKFSYKKNDGTYSEPRILSSNNNVITSDVVNGNETVTASIVIWIDSEAGNEIMNHYFFGKVIITGEQFVSRNFKEATTKASNTFRI